MGSWYWIGVSAGLGAGAGVALAALAPRGRLLLAIALAAAVGAAVGVGIGQLVGGWVDAAGGGAGGLLGAASATPVVLGALRGGGTRLGVGAIVAGSGLAVAALGLVPGLGFLEAAAAPLAALRVRRPGGRRYAGLRILAK